MRIDQAKSLAVLHQHSPEALAFPEEFIFPAYGGQSIYNIPASVCQLLNVPLIHPAALKDEFIQPIMGDVENLVLILIDAISYARFLNWSRDEALIWKRFMDEGVFGPLSSICPSTTSAATSTYWTGLSPAAHGVSGYEMWLREYSMVINTILHKPISYGMPSTGLEAAGFKAERFLPGNRMGTYLQANGVSPNCFQHYSIVNSGLSSSFLQDAQIRGVSSYADHWISLREQLEAQKGVKTYNWVYWGDYDGTSHINGPDSERAQAEFIHFSEAFERYFFDKLGPTLRSNTAVIVTSDHGQIHTDPGNVNFDLRNHPDLLSALRMNPTGENRLAYLYLKPGKQEEVETYFETTWPGQFVLVESGFALEHGLLGPGKPHPELENRVGDLMVIARDEAYLWWADKPNPLIGRHGGLSADEMIVPYLAFKMG